MYERFTDYARSVVQLSFSLRSFLPTSEAFVVALFTHRPPAAERLMTHMGHEAESVLSHWQASVSCRPMSSDPESDRANRIVESAIVEAQRSPCPDASGQGWVDTAHLLCAILHQDDCAGVALLRRAGIEAGKIPYGSREMANIHRVTVVPTAPTGLFRWMLPRHMREVATELPFCRSDDDRVEDQT